jgi:hypothetical protein
MEAQEIARHLRSLVHLDVDAVNVYDEALEHVTEEAVRTRFTEFRDEHDYHATALSAEIVALGEEAPKRREDLAGELAELMTSLRASRGTEGAVKAMRTAEHYHNRRYREAQSWDAETKLKDILQRFYGDEQRHLEFCEQWLAQPAKR